MDTQASPLYHYRAFVNRVVDGDTLDLTVDLGMHVSIHIRVRLTGIDTPEVYGVKKDSAEYALGSAASARVRELVESTWVTICTEKDSTEKYGRYLAHVFIDGHDKSLNELLVEEGHATST